jgi:hypothetical protein
MRMRRAIAGVLLLGQVAACSKMRTVPEPVPYMRTVRPAQIWVTPAGGLESVILAPTLVGDSVAGWDEMGQQLMMPVSEIEIVRTRQFDLTRTALLATGITALAVAAGFAVFGGFATCDNGGPTAQTNNASNCPWRPHEGADATDPQLRTGSGLRISVP